MKVVRSLTIFSLEANYFILEVSSGDEEKGRLRL